MRRPSAGSLARLAVAAGLTTYVLWRSEPGEALRALGGADWRYVGAAVALVLADRALMAFRWLVLLRPLAETRPPFHAVLRVFFISTFVGTFLPASVGGDAVRAYALSRQGVRLPESVASVLLDRVFGIIAILLVAGLAAPFAPPSVPRWLPAAVLLAAASGSLGLALALFSTTVERMGRAVLQRLAWPRIRLAGVSLLEALRRYRQEGSALMHVLAGSIGVQLLRVAQAWLLGVALGIPLGITAYLIYVPVILLIMQLPVTINGLGTSQWAFVAFFGESGVQAPDAFALSVLFVALGMVGNLPGGLLYATGGIGGRRQGEGTERTGEETERAEKCTTRRHGGHGGHGGQTID